MERELSPELAKLIVDSARDYAIFTMDHQRKVTSWNNGAERLTGWSTDEILGLAADVLFTDEDRAANRPAFELAQAERTGTAEDERWHVRKNGTRFWANGLVMRLDDGRGFVKILRDQTAQKIADDERDALVDELARANALQNELLGLVSHELRSPLTTVIGTADVLTRVSSLSERARQTALEDIRDAGKRMEELIANMLGLARASIAGELELEPVLLQHELPRIVNEHERAFPQRVIKVQVDDDLPPVAAQRVYLAQVLRNLLDNSQKYADAELPAEIRAERKGKGVAISVRDRGPELPGEVVESMFSPFYRHEAVMHRSRGVGLGMTVCQRLVQAQGGEIDAAARPGGGLEVWFTLAFADG